MGRIHAQCYATLPEVEVAIIYAPSEMRAAPLAEEFDAVWTGNLDEIISNESIQVLSICLPTPQHPEVTIKALEHSKHVLCEKPLALSEEEGSIIVETANQTDRTVMIGHVLRFWPEYVELYRVVSSGELGKPMAGFASRRSSFPAWSELYRKPELTGGAVVDLQIHDLDMLNWIFGEPLWVHAEGLKDPKGQGWDHNLITVAYGEAVAAAEGSVMMPPSYPFSSSLRVVCEKGCVEYNFRAGGRSVEMGSASGTELVVYPQQGESRVIIVEQEDPYQSQIDYFVECVRNGAPAERAAPKDALRALRVALAARESMQQGVRISLS